MATVAALHKSTTEQELAKKKKKCLSYCNDGMSGESLGWWFKVMGGSTSVPFHSFVIALVKQYNLQTTSRKSKRLKPTVKCNDKTNVTLIAFEWQIG